MKSFKFLATRKIHHTPTSGAKLISLDYNYTKEYNRNYDEFYGFHHCSFWGIDFRHKGAKLVAKIPKNYIQKLKKSILAFTILLISSFKTTKEMFKSYLLEIFFKRIENEYRNTLWIFR
ncbi:hypothetical protein [Helicobacter mesocricetorum]|uniref:hypothetical protein n=1 Tax=Helicobacter mesocricetorum TaxID=87012 RepID=UPI001F1ED9C8|nr:hypothetical protein [Helicobacter mesocricetorum]